MLKTGENIVKVEDCLTSDEEEKVEEEEEEKVEEEKEEEEELEKVKEEEQEEEEEEEEEDEEEYEEEYEEDEDELQWLMYNTFIGQAQRQSQSGVAASAEYVVEQEYFSSDDEGYYLMDVPEGVASPALSVHSAPEMRQQTPSILDDLPNGSWQYQQQLENNLDPSAQQGVPKAKTKSQKKKERQVSRARCS